MSCEDCKRRREAIKRLAARVAEWIKNPVGNPPDISDSDSDQTKMEGK